MKIRLPADEVAHLHALAREAVEEARRTIRALELHIAAQQYGYRKEGPEHGWHEQ